MKIQILVLLIAVSMLSAKAQDNYFKFYPGYAFAASKDALETEITETFSRRILATFGSGLNAGITYGHLFNDNVGIEVSVSYFHSDKITASDFKKVIGNNLTQNIASVYSNQVRLAPSLIVTSDREKLNYYAKAGLFLPAGGLLVFENVSLTDTTGNGSFDRETYQKKEIKGRFSVGFSAAIGLDYQLSDRFSIYAEAEMINLRVKYKTATITEFTRDGVDQLPGKDTWEIEKNYVDELTASSNNEDFNPNFDPDKPEDLLIEQGPFSSLGINLGVKVTLGKKH